MRPILATLNRQARLSRLLPVSVGLVFLGAGSVATSRSEALLINESPSLPPGLYVRTWDPIERGATVAVPQPQAARPYLSGLGMPGGVLLIKRVAAVGGDAVCSDGRGLVSPGGVHPVRSRDRQGQPLSPWSGCRRLGPGELFLLGDTAGSFDSRYFGPVSRDEVRGVYREVMTW